MFGVQSASAAPPRAARPSFVDLQYRWRLGGPDWKKGRNGRTGEKWKKGKQAEKGKKNVGMGELSRLVLLFLLRVWPEGEAMVEGGDMEEWGEWAEMEVCSCLRMLSTLRLVRSGRKGRMAVDEVIPFLPSLPFLPARPTQLIQVLYVGDLGLGFDRWKHRGDSGTEHAIGRLGPGYNSIGDTAVSIAESTLSLSPPRSFGIFVSGWNLRR